MADKTKNCGKGQLTSTDAKELYEAFMTFKAAAPAVKGRTGLR